MRFKTTNSCFQTKWPYLLFNNFERLTPPTSHSSTEAHPLHFSVHLQSVSHFSFPLHFPVHSSKSDIIFRPVEYTEIDHCLQKNTIRKKNILPTLDYLKVTWKSPIQNNEIDNLTAENLNGDFNTYVKWKRMDTNVAGVFHTQRIYVQFISTFSTNTFQQLFTTVIPQISHIFPGKKG